MLVLHEQLKRAIPALEEVDKAFVAQFNKHDPIMLAQTSFFMQLGIENPELMKAGFNLYKSVSASFHTDMYDMINKFQNGKLSWANAMKQFKSMTGANYKDLFKAGAMSVGNEYYDKLGMTRRDISFLNKARRNEMKYFKRFLNDIKNPLHKPRHPYLKRAGYYSNTGKAQFYNGMLAGAGDKVWIYWRLGVPQLEHCDVCPILSKKRYTWKTLPTTPRAGDTPCLFRCYCRLEFKPRDGKLKGGDPDRGIHHGLGGDLFPKTTADNMAGKITDKFGKLVDAPDELMQKHHEIRRKLNQARQMMEGTHGTKYKIDWIKKRRMYNRQLLELGKQHPGYRFLPTEAVGDLVGSMRSAMAKGGYLMKPHEFQMLKPGDEVVWLRGLQAETGQIIRFTDGTLGIRFGTGRAIKINSLGDCCFALKGDYLNARMGDVFAQRFGATQDQIIQMDRWMLMDDVIGQADLKYFSDKLGRPVTAKEVRDWIGKYRLEVYNAGGDTLTKYTVNGKLSSTRDNLHKKLMEKILDKGTTGNDALFTGGYSGSGKSAILDKLYPGWKDKYVNLNTDMIKDMLARADDLASGVISHPDQYKGLGYRAGLYHEESKVILKQLMAEVQARGLNILYDGTMANFGASRVDWLTQLQKSGYKATGVFADLSLQNCQYRAISRAKIGNDLRFVDPYLIMSQEGKCLKNFKSLQKYFDDWKHYSTDVPKGVDPILLREKTLQDMVKAVAKDVGRRVPKFVNTQEAVQWLKTNVAESIEARRYTEATIGVLKLDALQGLAEMLDDIMAKYSLGPEGQRRLAFLNATNSGGRRRNAYANLATGRLGINLGDQVQNRGTSTQIKRRLDWLETNIRNGVSNISYLETHFSQTASTLTKIANYKRALDAFLIEQDMLTKTLTAMKSKTYNSWEYHSSHSVGNKIGAKIKIVVAHEAGHIIHELNLTKVKRFFVQKGYTMETSSSGYMNRCDAPIGWEDKFAITLRGKDNFFECIAENFALYMNGNSQRIHSEMRQLFKALEFKP